MLILSCVRPNCEAAVSNKKRSLCKRHYNSWYYAEARGTSKARPVKPVVVPAFTCAYCGRDHEASPAEPRRKQVIRKFCNRTCNSAHENNRQKLARLATRSPRNCLVCGVDITERKADAKFCSTFCSDVSRGARFAEPLPAITCALDGCEAVFTPKSRRQKCCCENHGAIHCNRKGRASGRYENEPWNERRKSHYQKRRAQKLQLPADDIRSIDVYERDEWVCGLCAEPVDRTTVWPDPMSPSLDHILPLSKGGHHIMANVQLAHLSCNVRKGASTEADAMLAS